MVRAFAIGCAFLLVVGCAGVRSEAPKEQEQGRAEVTEGQARSSEATASEEARCEGTRTFDVLKEQGIDYISDSSVKPGDPGARRITNDVPGCPNGGPLSGTDKPDRLAGVDGEDEVRGLGAADMLSGGPGPDVVYGGPGGDALYGGGGRLEFEPFTDRSKNVLHGQAGGDELTGQAGDDVLYGGAGDDKELWGVGGEDVIYGGDGDDILFGTVDGGERDELYCGKGNDEYDADKNDYVDSSCEVKWHP
jgi:Ca2+-binding RTX toxin-like protein